MATEIATTTWSGFYDNETLVNSTNWLKYFSMMIKNGTSRPAPSSSVYEGGLQPHMQSDKSITLDYGSAYLDSLGIYKDYSPATFSALGVNDVNRLAYLIKDGNTIKIMEEKNFSPTVDGAKTYLYQYYRGVISNYTFYGMPLFYQIKDNVYDLRRFVSPPINPSEYAAYQSFNYTYSSSATPDTSSKSIGRMAGIDSTYHAFLQAYGGLSYNLTIPSGCVASNLDIFQTPGCSNEPTRITITNQKSSAVSVNLYKYYPVASSGVDIDFTMVSDWTSNTGYYSKSLAAGTTMTLILIPMTMIADSVDGVKFTYAVISG